MKEAQTLFWEGYARGAPAFTYDYCSRDCPRCGPHAVFFRKSRTREAFRCRCCGYQEPRKQYESPTVLGSEPLPEEPPP